MKRLRAGFTIIELLVVIAIIGILAAIVLASLNDARDQGINAKVKTEMDAITKRAEIDYNTSLTYDTVCGSNGFATSTVVEDIITSINQLASSTVTCNSTSDAYAASVAVDTVYWCVDSIGTRKELGSDLGSGVTECP